MKEIRFNIVADVNSKVSIFYLYLLNKLYGIEFEFNKEDKPIKAVFGKIYYEIDALIKEVENEE